MPVSVNQIKLPLGAPLPDVSRFSGIRCHTKGKGTSCGQMDCYSDSRANVLLLISCHLGRNRHFFCRRHLANQKGLKSPASGAKIPNHLDSLPVYLWMSLKLETRKHVQSVRALNLHQILRAGAYLHAMRLERLQGLRPYRPITTPSILASGEIRYPYRLAG